MDQNLWRTWSTRIVRIILRLNRTVTFMRSPYLANHPSIMVNHKHFIFNILSNFSIAHSHIAKIWNPYLATTKGNLWDIKFATIPHQAVIEPGYTKPHESYPWRGCCLYIDQPFEICCYINWCQWLWIRWFFCFCDFLCLFQMRLSGNFRVQNPFLEYQYHN